MTDKTFSSKSNAVRDARKALGAEAQPGEHFALAQAGDRWTWSDAAREIAFADEAPRPAGSTRAALDSLTDDAVDSPAPEDVDQRPAPVHEPEVRAAASRKLKPLDAHGEKVLELTRAGTTRDVAEAIVSGQEHKEAAAAPKPKREPKAKPAAIPAAPTAPAAERGPRKSDQLLALAKRAEGVTTTEIMAVTGWSKIGGFHDAVKRAGLQLVRRRETKETRWFALDASDEGRHVLVRRAADQPWAYLGVRGSEEAALAAADLEDGAIEHGADREAGVLFVAPRTSLVLR